MVPGQHFHQFKPNSGAPSETSRIGENKFRVSTLLHAQKNRIQIDGGKNL
jgi:hypothetical protein